MMQSTLFETSPGDSAANILPKDGGAHYHPKVFTEQDCMALMRQLQASLKWEPEQLMMFGRLWMLRGLITVTLGFLTALIVDRGKCSDWTSNARKLRVKCPVPTSTNQLRAKSVSLWCAFKSTKWWELWSLTLTRCAKTVNISRLLSMLTLNELNDL